MFYEFAQNNSGGVFVIEENLGVGTSIVIEAETPDQAIEKFRGIGERCVGFYDFCTCCGDRWNIEKESEDWDTVEEIGNIKEYINTYNSFGRPKLPAFIHYLGGKVEEVNLKQQQYSN